MERAKKRERAKRNLPAPMPMKALGSSLAPGGKLHDLWSDSLTGGRVEGELVRRSDLTRVGPEHTHTHTSTSTSNNFIIPQEIHMWCMTLKTESTSTLQDTKKSLVKGKSIERYKMQY